MKMVKNLKNLSPKKRLLLGAGLIVLAAAA
jgi:hypothetical protein